MGKYIALGIYILILCIITYFSSRRGSVNDFLVASRNIGWIRIGIAIFASLLSSYNIIIGITFSYILGPWVFLIYLGVFLAFVGIYYLVKNQNKEVLQGREFITIVDWIAYRFGTRNATLFNLCLMLTLFAFIVLNFFVNTNVISNIFGLNKYFAAISVGVIVLLYTLIGGLKVSILTDVFQGILMLMLGGMVFLVDTSRINTITVNSLLTNNTVIFGAVSLCVVQFLSILTWPELWQRVYATKTVNDLKKGFILSSFLLLVLIIPQMIIGLTSRSIGRITDPSNLFYDILKTSTPDWYLPFLAVSLISAFMSTLDASLFAFSIQLGKFGLRIKSEEENERKNEKIVKNARTTMVIVTIAGLILSLFYSNFLSAVFQLCSLITVISVIIVLSLVIKASDKEVFLATIVGIFIFTYVVFKGLITDAPYTSLYPSMTIFVFMILQNLIVKFYAKLKFVLL